MPRTFQYSISGKADLCLENQSTRVRNFLPDTEDFRNVGASIKKTGMQILSVLLKKSAKTIRILKKRTQRSLRLLAKEIAAAQTKKKTLSPVGRLIAKLPALSVTLSAGIVMFLFFAALAAAERGAWGFLGGEGFAVAAGVGLFYQAVKNLA